MQLPVQINTTDIRATDGIYTVLVNDQPLCTPKGHPVRVLSWELANDLADELMAEGVVDLQRLTLYSLYATQHDFVEDRIDATIGTILQHLTGDFVLHPDPDPALAAKQLAAWAPLWGFLRDIGPEVPMARPLQAVQIPWELREDLRMQLMAMTPAQLTAALQAVTSFSSVVLGILLARQAIEVDHAVAALTVTAAHVAGRTAEDPEQQEQFAADVRQMLQRLLRYVQLGA
ncbi:MAG TPA: ATP12 family protein [Candidatus Tectomicrobia bacterium]|nr:ATP12 family protein [Candidatus Tectomicrobia bacterium]